MILSINQPAYFPWLGYFDRIAKSDLHIVLDDVQIERNTKTSFTNRNKIRTRQGWSWITVPINKGNTLDDSLINNINISGQHWKRKHLQAITQSYSRSTYFSEHEEWLMRLYNNEWVRLVSLLKESTKYILKYLGIDTPIIYSSEMNVVGEKSNLILNYCNEVGASKYLSGPFGRDYLDISIFDKSKVKVEYHDYQHPEYNQLHGEFVPYMSIIDLLFNQGKESSGFFIKKK